MNGISNFTASTTEIRKALYLTFLLRIVQAIITRLTAKIRQGRNGRVRSTSDQKRASSSKTTQPLLSYDTKSLFAKQLMMNKHCGGLKERL